MTLIRLKTVKQYLNDDVLTDYLTNMSQNDIDLLGKTHEATKGNTATWKIKGADAEFFSREVQEIVKPTNNFLKRVLGTSMLPPQVTIPRFNRCIQVPIRPFHTGKIIPAPTKPDRVPFIIPKCAVEDFAKTIKAMNKAFEHPWVVNPQRGDVIDFEQDHDRKRTTVDLEGLFDFKVGKNINTLLNSIAVDHQKEINDLKASNRHFNTKLLNTELERNKFSMMNDNQFASLEKNSILIKDLEASNKHCCNVIRELREENKACLMRCENQKSNIEFYQDQNKDLQMMHENQRETIRQLTLQLNKIDEVIIDGKAKRN